MSAIPDYFSALTGWRKFNVMGPTPTQVVLVSANHPHPWLTVESGEAVCLAESMGFFVSNNGALARYEKKFGHDGEEPAPALKCSCGFYAYKERASAEAHQQGSVLASVQMWGRLVEHDRGYRAERMRIVALHVLETMLSGTIAALQRRYQIPITQEERTAWISESPDASSSLSQSANQYLNALQIYQNQLASQSYQQAYLSALRQMQSQQVMQVMLSPKAPVVALDGPSISSAIAKHKAKFSK